MTCSDDAVARLLAGDLAPGPAAAIDAHLLTCDSCWRAVCDGRAGREAARGLREPAPPELADRIRGAVVAAAATGAGARPRRRRYVAVLALTCAVLLVTSTLRERDPSGSLEHAIAAATAGAGVARIDAYAVDGEEIALARPSRVVAMPTAALAGAAVDGTAWTVHVDGVTVVCTRDDRVVVAGRMPAARLVEVAASLGYS